QDDGRQPLSLRVVHPHARRRQASRRAGRLRRIGQRRTRMKRLRESPTPAVDRRQFIKVSALAGGGLLFGTYLRFGESVAHAETAPVAENFAPNVFISIAPSGAVSIIAPNSEMGQGIKTGLPMIVAEELDVAWENVTIVQGDLNPAYGRQASVGSGSTVGN